MKKYEKKHNKVTAVAVIAAGILAVLILCVAVILSKNVFVSGRLIPIESQEIDLSGRKVDASRLLRLKAPAHIILEDCGVSVEEFDRLRDAFPDCEIIWSVPLSSGPVSSRSSELTLSSISKSDLPLFAYFDHLETIHAEGVSEWEILSELEKRYPDVGINWGVTLNGKYYSADIEELDFKETVDVRELNEKLAAFTKLERVSLQNDEPSTDEMLSLQEKYPDILFCFTVEEFGGKYLTTADSLDFSNDNSVDLPRLIQIAPLFRTVKSIDFTGCGYSNDEMYKVMQAYPETDICWQFELYGKEVSSLDEEIDFSGIQISDTSEIENALPLFKHLQKVIMSYCGIRNEEMDALNKRHDDVRFVWTVTLGAGRRGMPTYELRTDTTYFISSLQLGEENAYRLFDDTAEPLKYCTDMVALDLGHNKITKCEFCRYMPKLRFFIAAGSPLNDLSPLAECKELYFLELQFCPVTDLSPLLECKELRHLCVCACPTQDSVRTVLSQMTWLERCYMYGRTAFYTSDRDYVCSDGFLPNTEKWLLGGMGFYVHWRTHPSYFEMRDALGGAYYMAAKPNEN